MYRFSLRRFSALGSEARPTSLLLLLLRRKKESLFFSSIFWLPHTGSGAGRVVGAILLHQRLAFAVNDVMGNMSYLRNERPLTGDDWRSWNWPLPVHVQLPVRVYGRALLLPTGVG